MFLFQFSASNPIRYYFTGKFEAPAANWVHEEFPLGEFELFVMTEGTLYLSYNQEEFVVESGEFLLLPPTASQNAKRRGYRPSFCSFYWLHFLPENEYSVKEVKDNMLTSCLSSPPPRKYILYPAAGAYSKSRTDNSAYETASGCCKKPLSYHFLECHDNYHLSGIIQPAVA